MRYKVLDRFKAITTQGEMELPEGKLITLSHDLAVRLMNEGKIKVFCYWLKSVVDDCQMPCFEIEARKVLHECPHFKTFWALRLSELQKKEANNVDR